MLPICQLGWDPEVGSPHSSPISRAGNPDLTSSARTIPMHNPNSLGCSGTTAVPSTVGINHGGGSTSLYQDRARGYLGWAGRAQHPQPTAGKSQENSLEGGAWALAAGAMPGQCWIVQSLAPQSSPCSWAHPCRGSYWPSLTPALAQTRSQVDHLKIQQGHMVPVGTHRL